MENKICSVFGHREVEITEELSGKTECEILKAINFGCRNFYFGGFGDFDDLCYKIVTKIKEEKSEFEIKRFYCVTQERYLRKKSRYFKPENYDEIIFLVPSFEGWYKSIYFRNCAMIDESDFVLFYAEERENSGAFKAYKYAKKQKGKTVVNIY